MGLASGVNEGTVGLDVEDGHVAGQRGRGDELAAMTAAVVTLSAHQRHPSFPSQL